MPAVRKAAGRPGGRAAPAPQRPIASDEERIRLKGPPNALVGTVRLSRSPEEAVPLGADEGSAMWLGRRPRPARARLVSSSLPSPPRRTRLSFGSSSPPESTARVPVRFAVPPGTAPALYEAVFDIGGEKQTVEIEVLADERLRIATAEPLLAGAAGETVVGELLFSNRGNVPLKLDVLGVVVLDDLEPLCLGLERALAAVRTLPEEKDAHRVFLDRLVKDYADRKPGLVRVRIAGGPVILEPGDSRALDVEFHLPRDLPPGRRYRGVLELGTGRVLLRIDSTSPKGSRERVAQSPAAPRTSGKEGP